MSKRRRRIDHRREWILWVAAAADQAGISAVDAFAAIAEHLVDPAPELSPSRVSPYYRIPRFEDHLPSRAAWDEHAEFVRTFAETLDAHRDDVDQEIKKASPRWRLDRMPVVDRNLLRLGVTEFLYRDDITPRATINSYVELAKVYGEERSRKFINGILDQIRRNLSLPFS